MEDFILGLLMPNKLTAYEVHQVIKNNYEGVCSSSIGNVQRALKKLHEKGFVKLNEIMEGKIVKKRFEITKDGRRQFLKWLTSPLQITRANNMETGKLLLLGFLPPAKRIEMIEGQIADLKEELEYLQAIEASVEERLAQFGNSRIEIWKAHVEANKDYMDELMESTGAKDIFTVLDDIGKYAELTLRLGLDEAKFNLDWFGKLRDEMVAEMEK